MTIQERIELLENQNRKLKKFVASACVLALVAIIAGLPQWTNASSKNIAANSITTKRLRILNSKGQTRVDLRVTGDGENGSIFLKNTKNITEMWVSGRGFIRYGKSNGRPRTLIGKEGMTVYRKAGLIKIQKYK